MALEQLPLLLAKTAAGATTTTNLKAKTKAKAEARAGETALYLCSALII